MGIQVSKIGAGAPKTAGKKEIAAAEKDIQIFSGNDAQTFDDLTDSYKDKFDENYNEEFYKLAEDYKKQTSAQNPIEAPKQEIPKTPEPQAETAPKKDVKPAEIDYSAEFSDILEKYQDKIEIVQGSDSIMPEEMKETILHNQIAAADALKKREEAEALKKAEAAKAVKTVKTGKTKKGKKSQKIQIDVSVQNIRMPETIDSITAQKLDKRLGAGFTAKLERIAKNANCNPNDLAAILCVESELKPGVKNPNSPNYGLMQIQESRLRRYGTTGPALLKMNGVQQLDYIEKYLQEENKSGQRLDLGNLYAKVFLPGRAKNEILCRKGEAAYRKNYRALDFDNNGDISKTDLANAARRKMKIILSALS